MEVKSNSVFLGVKNTVSVVPVMNVFFGILSGEVRSEHKWTLKMHVNAMY